MQKEIDDWLSLGVWQSLLSSVNIHLNFLPQTYHSTAYIDKWVESFNHWCWYQCQPWWRHKSQLAKTSPCCNRSAMRNWEFRPIGCWSVGCAGNSERLVREIADGLQFVRKLHFPLSFSSFSPEWLSNHLNTNTLRLYSPGHPSAWLPWSLINLATWNPIALVTFHVPVESVRQPILCWFQNFVCIWVSSVNLPVVSIKTGAHLHNTLSTKFSSKPIVTSGY